MGDTERPVYLGGPQRVLLSFGNSYLGVSILGLMKSGKLWENVELRVVNWGKPSKTCSLRFPPASLHL